MRKTFSVLGLGFFVDDVMSGVCYAVSLMTS